ncbi:MAG: leucine-rich repeat protein [Bacteroidaceae bacterium]|nr:leucine-rich repeat protein [Bacteroidaceae bacterium]
MVDALPDLKSISAPDGSVGVTTVRSCSYVLCPEYMNCTPSIQYVWSSSNTSVASFSSSTSSSLTGKAKGKTTVTVKATYNGKTVTGTANYKVVETEKIELKDRYVGTSGESNYSYPVSSSVTPSAASYNFDWKSSDESVATIYSNGYVIGHKEGKATITATAKDGSGVSGSCEVTVIDGYSVNSYHGYGDKSNGIDIKYVQSSSSDPWDKWVYFKRNGELYYEISTDWMDNYENSYTYGCVGQNGNLKYVFSSEGYTQLQYGLLFGGSQLPSMTVTLDGATIFTPSESYSYDGNCYQNYTFGDGTSVWSTNGDQNWVVTPGNHVLEFSFSHVNSSDRNFVCLRSLYFSGKSVKQTWDEIAAENKVAMEHITVLREGTLGGEALKLHENFTDFTGLSITGPLDDYDWRTLREMTNLRCLDLSEAIEDEYPNISLSQIKAVKLSKHVAEINRNPFDNAGYYYVPDEVKSISAQPLRNSNLVFFMDGAKGVEKIAERAFEGSNLGGAYSLPNLKSVPSRAFMDCKYLSDLTLAKATEIGDSAFAKSASLVSVDAPVATKIGAYSFYKTNVKEAKFPKVESVGRYAFFAPVEKVSLPNVKTLDVGAFSTAHEYRYKEYSWSSWYSSNTERNAATIEDVDISLIEEIGDSVFYGQTKIKTLVTPKLRLVGDDAFYYNSNLSSIDLSNVTAVGRNAFYDCQQLQKTNLKKAVTIGAHAFYDNQSLKDVDLTSVQKLGGSAFSSCRSLPSVSIPNVNNVPSDAFSGCTSITSLDARRATYFGSNAFSGCGKLETANLSKADTICSQAFYNCTSLKEINLPNLTNLGSSAFQGCKSATNIKLSDKLTVIGGESFFGCTAAETLTLPASLTRLPDRCFNGSNNIKTININAPAPPAVGETPFTMQTLYTAKLNVPESSIALYQVHDYWKHFYYWGVNPDVLKDLILASSINLGSVRMDKTHLTINPGVSLSMSGTSAQEFRSVLFKANATQAGMLLSDCSRISSDQTSAELDMTGLKWYFIALPFDVTVSDITNSENAQLAIYSYDGATRASKNATGYSWSRIRDGKLTAGQGYIIQASKATLLTLPATYETKDVPFQPNDITTALAANVANSAAHQGWNFVGNPYPTYFDIAKLDFAAPITVWNGSTYVAYTTADDDYALPPMTPFFVQCPTGVKNLKFHAEGRQVTAEITRPSEVKGQFSSANRRYVVDLTLAGNEHSDRTRVVVNSLATDAYDMNCDAAKMMSMDEQVPQLYTMRSGVEYAINEGPQEDGIIDLGFLAPAEGQYTIRLGRHDVNVKLIDNLTGETIELGAEGYTFNSVKGEIHDRFQLMIEETEETAIAGVNAEQSGEDVYDLTGKRLSTRTRGVNIIRKGGSVSKQLNR